MRIDIFINYIKTRDTYFSVKYEIPHMRICLRDRKFVRFVLTALLNMERPMT